MLRGDPGAPRIIHGASHLLGSRQQIGMRQRDRLLAPGTALFLENELDVHGIGVAQRNGRLQPFEINLVFAAERVRTGLELAEVENLPSFYDMRSDSTATQTPGEAVADSPIG